MTLTTVTPVQLGAPQPAAETLIPISSFGTEANGVIDDTAAIQDGVDAVESNGGGTLFFEKGTYLVGSDDVEVLWGSNVKAIAEPGVQLKLDHRIAGYHGCITVPEGCDNYWIQGFDFMGLYPGTGTRTDPSNSGIWVYAGDNGVIKDCTFHHFDGSGLSLFSGRFTTASLTNVLIENCGGYSNGIDGLEINVGGYNGFTSGVRFLNCWGHSNQFAGLELTGNLTTGSAALAWDIVIDNFHGWSNLTDGIYIVPVSPNTFTRLMLANIHCHENTSYGVNLTNVTKSTLSNINCWGNGQSGLNLESQDIEASGLYLHDNTVRGLRSVATCMRVNINGIHASGNGSGASAGQAAIDVGVGGTGSEDINITGILCKGNSKEGVQYTSTKRGYVEGTIVGNGSTGLRLVGADRLHGQVSCINNTGAGMSGTSTPTRCALDLMLTDDTGGGTQTTGWSLANGTNNHIREIYNDCSTARSDSGTGTVNTTH